MSVIRKDSELWKRLITRAPMASRVKVGIPEGAGKHDNSDATVAQIAQWLHDGTSTIDARPFLSGPLDGRNKEVRVMVERIAKAILDGKLTNEAGLDLLGQWARDRVVAAINAGIPPELAQSTIDRKGSSLPLVDSAQMKGSITYIVGD